MSVRLNQVGNKAGKITCTIRNAESSATIPKGTPVVLNLSTTASASGDGLDVVLPGTAGNPLSYAIKFGVATDNITAGQYGESVLFGYVSYALVLRATRAATTDTWSASGTVASGVPLGIDTVNNVFTAGASIAASVASNAALGVLIDSLSTIAGSASATSDTRTAITNSARVFVRML